MRGEPKFMQEAIELAVANVRDAKGGPFGALVVKDGAVIAREVNEVTRSNDPTAHAEVVAIRAACKQLGAYQLTGCEIYSSCEPCPMCLGAIYWARPEKVFYGSTKEDAAAAGFDDSLIYRELALSKEQRKVVMVELMRREAGAAFAEWARSPFKEWY